MASLFALITSMAATIESLRYLMDALHAAYKDVLAVLMSLTDMV